ncbi:VPLPA-CTERM sorting domain-containing protein [Dongia sp. agr-C8]
MKIRNWLFALGGAVMALAAIKPAAATPINFDVTFGASNFTGLFGPGAAPAPFVLGHLNLTFDPTANVIEGSTATLDFIDPLVFSDSLSFNYSAGTDSLTIGGTTGGAAGLTFGIDDFSLVVLNFTSGTPLFGSLLYEQASVPNVFGAASGLVHVTQSAVATTPIPAALPLLVSALGGLGLVGWRRRKSAAA